MSQLEAELRGSLIWNRISADTKRHAGARKPFCGERSLWFLVGGEYARADHKILISLESADVHTVTYLRVDRATWAQEELSRVEYVNGDSLDSVIHALVSA